MSVAEPEDTPVEVGNQFTAESLDAALEALYRQVQSEPGPIDPTTCVQVGDQSVPNIELLICEDLDIEHAKVQSGPDPIDPATCVQVEDQFVSNSELLICEDLDVEHVKFAPEFVIVEEEQPRPAPPRMGTTRGGFDVNDIMGLDDDTG
jgi:hypothetical protein